MKAEIAYTITLRLLDINGWGLVGPDWDVVYDLASPAICSSASEIDYRWFNNDSSFNMFSVMRECVRLDIEEAGR